MTIDFVKEIQYIMSFKNSYNRNTLDNILKNFNTSASFDSSVSISGLSLMTKILDSSVKYDYLQCKVDLFVINDTEHDPRDYYDKQALLPLDVLSKINYKLIDFLNTRQPNEQIAFIYDYSSNTFDVILNYDSKEYIKNIVVSAHAGISQYCENNPSNSHNYALKSWITKLDERIEQYQHLASA